MKKLSLLAITVMPFLALPIAVHANPVGIPAPVPEPATIAAGAICLIPLAVGAVRAFRKDRK